MKLTTKKNLLKLLAIALLLCAAAHATTVTATVLDPSGIPYAGGTVSVVLTSPGGVTPIITSTNAYVFSPGPATLNSSGFFSITLQDNTTITPASTQWRFTVCSGASTVQPAVGPGSVCFTTSVTISGGSQDVSATLNASAPALTNLPASTAFLGSVAGGSSTVVPSANVPSVIGVFVPTRITVSKFIVQLTAASGASNTSIGLYDRNGNALCTTAADTSTFNTTAVINPPCTQGTVSLGPQKAYFVICSAGVLVRFQGSNIGSLNYFPQANQASGNQCTNGLVPNSITVPADAPGVYQLAIGFN